MRIVLDVPPSLECPVRSRIEGSLEREGLVVGDYGEPSPARLSIAVAEATLIVELRAGEDVLVSRTLDTTSANDVRTCAALADAIALVAARGLGGVEWSGTIPPPPEPSTAPAPSPDEPRAAADPVERPADLGSPSVERDPTRPFAIIARAGVRIDRALEDAAAALGVGFQLAVRFDAITLSAGFAIAAPQSVAAGPGQVAITRYPLALDATYTLPLELPIELAFGVATEAEILGAESTDLARTENRSSWAIRAGPIALAGFEPMSRLSIAFGASALGLLVGRDFVVDGVGTVARHAAVELVACALIGFRFGG